MVDLRKIDALVAERIFGHEIFYRVVGGKKIPGIAHRDLPHYSSDIAAAWEVVEKMFCCSISKGVQGWFVSVTPTPGDLWNPTTMLVESQPTAPLAICLAALAAKGVSVES